MKDFSNCPSDSVYEDGASCFICREGRGNNKAKLPIYKASIPCNVLLLKALILLFIKAQFQYDVFTFQRQEESDGSFICDFKTNNTCTSTKSKTGG